LSYNITNGVCSEATQAQNSCGNRTNFFEGSSCTINIIVSNPSIAKAMEEGDRGFEPSTDPTRSKALITSSHEQDDASARNI
jgi:hypothetical protein